MAPPTPQGAGGDTSSLCSPEYWDEFWRVTPGITEAGTSPSHFFQGTRGIVARTLGQVIGDTSAETVCEFGGGGGRTLMTVARWAGARATCVDRSPLGLAKTRQVFEWAGMDVELIHADIFEHDFDGRQFDLVTHWGLVEHFPDPTAVFERTAQVLAPSGLTVFSMPNMLGFSSRWWRAWAPNSWAHHVAQTDEQIAQALDAAGLELVTSRCFGGVAFRPSRWEKHTLGPRLVTFAQRFSNVAQRLAPGLWTNTPCWCGQHRLFVAKHKSADHATGPSNIGLR